MAVDLGEVLEKVAAELGAPAQVQVDPTMAATTNLRLEGREVEASLSPRKGKVAVLVGASAPGAGDLFLKLYPEGGGSALGKVFGAQDVEIGESRFDDTFMIKASDESLARLWLAGEARKKIVDAHAEESSGFVVELEGGHVRVSWSEIECSHLRVRSAIEATVSLARRAAELREELDSLAEALDGEVSSSERLWRPESPMSIVVGEGDAKTTIGHESIALESRKAALYTTIRRRMPDALRSAGALCRPDAQKRALKLVGGPLVELSLRNKDLAFHYWAGGAFPLMVRGRLDPAVVDALLECMPAAVVLDGKELTIYLSGFQSRPPRLGRALNLVRALLGEAGKTTPRRDRRAAKGTPTPGRSVPSRDRGALYTNLAETFRACPLAGQGEVRGDSRLRVEVDGAQLAVEEESFSGSDIAPYTYLTIAAPAPGSEGLRLVLEEGDLDPLSSMLGFQDIEVGDDHFDGQYVIKANEEGHARLWLGAEVRRRILATRGIRGLLGSRFMVRKGWAQFQGSGAVRSPQRLEALLRAMAALANRNGKILDQCRSLADALGGNLVGDPRSWNPESGASVVIGQQQEAITIHAALSTALSNKPRLLTRVHLARISSKTDRYLVTKRDIFAQWRRLLDAYITSVEGDETLFRFLFLAGGENREELSNRLDEGLQRRLALAEPEALVVDSHDITCWLDGFVDDVDRLTLVMKIFASLGEGVGLSGPSGPYR